MSKQAANDTLKMLYLSSQLDTLHVSIGQLLQLSEDDDIESFLSLPKKSTRQKELFLRKLISNLPSELLTNLLSDILLEKSYDPFTRQPLEDFLHTLQKEAERILSIPVEVAVKFTPSDLIIMARLLSSQLGKQVVLDLTVNEQLIGGAIIMHASHRYDFSLKTKLGSLRSTWHAAVDKT